MYAIVKTGGKQYKVMQNSVFDVEKIEAEPGSTIELSEVLLISDGGSVRVGSPTVTGASVTATVVETSKGRKVNGFTYKPTKTIQRHYGHRQWHTRLRVTKIEA